MPKTFFTADSHFGHAGIIQMCGRPYSDIKTHDRALIDNWNAVVAPGDTVWHLGDFAYRAKPQRVRQLFDQLNGTKRLIVGNHDFKGPTRQLGWASIHELTETVVDGQVLVLCHYSLRVWRNMRRGALMLYGHSHGNLPGNRQSLDVGVDCTGYAPVTLPQIRSMLEALPPLQFRDDSDETNGDGA
jgi:calcineurin-like phosphoesterase family protein